MKKINLERLSNYAVILIAFSAFFVSIWQVRITHNHNKLLVKPYLDYQIDQLDSTLTVSVINQGFGPAIIKQAKFNYKGIEYDSLEKLLNGSGEIKNRIGSYQYSKNTLIGSGENKLLVKLKNREFRGILVHIIYETIYEEQYEFKFRF